MSLTVPPLSALPPPSVPPLPSVEADRLRSQVVFGTDGIDQPPQLVDVRFGPRTLTLVVALVIVVAACWALGARLIGPDAWVAVIGLGVVPCGVAALRGPR